MAKATKKATPATKATKTTFNEGFLKLAHLNGKRYACDTVNDLPHFTNDEIEFLGTIESTKAAPIEYNKKFEFETAGNPLSGATDKYYLIVE